MSDWIENILKGINKVGTILLSAIGYIKSILPFAEALVIWVKQKIEEYAPRVDDSEDPLTGPMATELIVNESQIKFHGSGGVYPKSFVLTIVKFVYKIFKSGRMGYDVYLDREELAVSKGYIKSEDLATARKAWPSLQPLD